jgi:hypothetical protein
MKENYTGSFVSSPNYSLFLAVGSQDHPGMVHRALRKMADFGGCRKKKVTEFSEEENQSYTCFVQAQGTLHMSLAEPMHHKWT